MLLSKMIDAVDFALPAFQDFLKFTNSNRPNFTPEPAETARILSRTIDAVGKLNEANLDVSGLPTITISLQTEQDLKNINDSLNPIIEEIITGLVNLGMALHQLLPPEPEHSIYLRFPTVNNFTDLAEAAGTFEKIFSQIIHEEGIDGSIRIDAFENGSLWTRIVVGTRDAVILLASIAWSSTVIYQKYEEARYTATIVKERNMQIEEHQKAVDLVLDLTRKAFIETEAIHIQKEHFDTVDPERLNRLKMVLDLLSKEMERGARIAPSLEAPVDVKQLFPKELTIVESKTKLLTDKKEVEK